MSRLVNQNWIGFDGEPVTGRAPPQLRVYGPELTPAQRGMVAHAYKLFTDACLVAVGQYHVRNRILEDGTRVRCVSFNGHDVVHVWTKPAEKKLIDYLSSFIIIPMQFDTSDSTWKGWGFPFESGGSSINYPLGTYGSTISQAKVDGSNAGTLVTRSKQGGSHAFRSNDTPPWHSSRKPSWDARYERIRAGNIDWIGPKGFFNDIAGETIITFIGPRGRHIPERVGANLLAPGPASTLDAFNYDLRPFWYDVYANGFLIATHPTYRILGAALRKHEGVSWIVCLACNNAGLDEIVITQRLSGTYGTVNTQPYNETTNPGGWKVIAEHVNVNTSEADYCQYTPFFFNASGTECQGIKHKARIQRVKWSITNEGVNSTATRSLENDATGAFNSSTTITRTGGADSALEVREYSSTLSHEIAVDYVGDEFVICSVVATNAYTQTTSAHRSGTIQEGYSLGESFSIVQSESYQLHAGGATILHKAQESSQSRTVSGGIIKAGGNATYTGQLAHHADSLKVLKLRALDMRKNLVVWEESRVFVDYDISGQCLSTELTADGVPAQIVVGGTNEAARTVRINRPNASGFPSDLLQFAIPSAITTNSLPSYVSFPIYAEGTQTIEQTITEDVADSGLENLLGSGVFFGVCGEDVALAIQPESFIRAPLVSAPLGRPHPGRDWGFYLTGGDLKHAVGKDALPDDFGVYHIGVLGFEFNRS